MPCILPVLFKAVLIYYSIRIKCIIISYSQWDDFYFLSLRIHYFGVKAVTMQVVSPQHWNRYTFILIQKCLSDHLLDYEMKSYDNPKSTGYLGILHSVRNWSIVISPCSVFTTPSTPSILISVPTTSLCSPCMTFTWNWWPIVNHSFSLYLIKCWLMTESIVACSLLMDGTNTMKTFTNIKRY